ncbi:MAG: glycoside hydrolase family 36 protein [Omnitrophica WOR_2 bacterium]
MFERSQKGPSLEDVQMGVFYHVRFSNFRSLTPGSPLWAGQPETVDSPHGPLRQIRLNSPPDPNGLKFKIIFALPEQHPFLLWRLEVENGGSQPVYIDRMELMNAGFFYYPASFSAKSLNLRQAILNRLSAVRPNSQPGELAFYSNGWQSWSYAGVYGQGQRFRHSRLGFLRAPAIVNPATPQPHRSGLYSSDMFGVLGDRNHRTGILAGFLSQKQQFGSLETYINPLSPALRMWANGDGARLDPKRQMATDWACVVFLHLDAPDPLGPYLDAVAREHAVDGILPGAGDAPVGWCSWYHYYKNVTRQDVKDNLASAGALRPGIPLDLIEIDDGYESQVGDWSSFSPAFPEGVAPLAAEIRQAGLTPGLWLAPFIVHPRSRLNSTHPDWLLRGRLGRPVNAGFLWGSFCSALDLTRPDVLSFVGEVIDTAVHRWGFPFLKLDFLYAAALPGHYHDRTRTRAQVLRDGLAAIRQAAGPETHLLGCGCPLGPAIGLVDSMRIGTDVEGRWEAAYNNIEWIIKNEASVPGARNASHNALSRAFLHKRWWINDPDCLLLRPGTHLTLAEVRSLAAVAALTGGTLLVSDPLPDLPPERLRILETLLPLIGRRPHVLDWFDRTTPARLQLDLEGSSGSWNLLALFNWENCSKDIELRTNDFYLDAKTEYLARSFWDNKVYRISPGDPLVLNSVPAHGVVLLSLRHAYPYKPLYLGSSLHISQGLEVSSWESFPNSLNFRLERPGAATGQVDLVLPKAPVEAFMDDQPLSWQALQAGVYRFPVQFNQAGTLRVKTG